MRPPLRPTLITAAVLGALALAPVASAHVTVHPNVVPAGGFTTLVIRVPNEEPKASTTGLDVQFPPGFLDVSYQPLAGWTATIKTRKLAEPQTTEEGETVTEEVDQVSWSGGKIGPGQYLDFPVSVAIPDKAGTKLTFKALQRYDNGETVRWIGAPGTEEPAPQVVVADKDAQVADYAETPAQPPDTATSASSETTSSSEDDDSDTSTIIAIVLGAAGLLAGIVALIVVFTRRRPATA
jgi:uncharacterized protein YcnI